MKSFLIVSMRLERISKEISEYPGNDVLKGNEILKRLRLTEHKNLEKISRHNCRNTLITQRRSCSSYSAEDQIQSSSQNKLALIVLKACGLLLSSAVHYTPNGQES